ncbi:MAG: hypothetical protein JXM75_01900 [Chromatiaceae bacterium]|nr:hypothetical protein [Chromatiaceae bacterium]
MSTEEQTPEEQQKKKPRSSLSWFPKVFLWGSVLAFGYLYLDSIDYFKRFENLSLDNLDETLLSVLDRAPEAPAGDSAEPAASAEPARMELAATSPAPVNAGMSSAPEAPAEATPEPAREPATVAQSSVQPPAAPATDSPAMAAPAQSPESFADRQARLMADYEAMRRAAEERMRQHWEQMRAAAPPVAVMPPPGYYYPAQAPGYYYPPAYPANPAAVQ